MTQTNNRFLDELAKLMTDAAGAAQGMRRDFETMVRSQGERMLREMYARNLTEEVIKGRIVEEVDKERFRRMTERQPLPRIGEPQEVAQAYLYCMRAGYTTGQVLNVDGGGTIV